MKWKEMKRKEKKRKKERSLMVLIPFKEVVIWKKWFYFISKIASNIFYFYWPQIVSQSLMPQNKWWNRRGVGLCPLKYFPPKYDLFKGLLTAY